MPDFISVSVMEISISFQQFRIKTGEIQEREIIQKSLKTSQNEGGVINSAI